MNLHCGLTHAARIIAKIRHGHRSTCAAVVKSEGFFHLCDGVTICGMDRRRFLGTLIGGVATAAAVRTWPFRVFSFPSKITRPLPEFVTLDQNFIHLGKDGVWRVDSVGSHLIGAHRLEGLPWYADNWLGDSIGIKRSPNPFANEIEIEEAKRLFPGPFHWEGPNGVRYSRLQPDGSVVDV